MELVIIESPYSGNVDENLEYLKRCIADCLSRGEAPFASHGLYTEALDDNDPKQRALGLAAGNAWRHCVDRTVVYTDLGLSPGMQAGIDHSEIIGVPVEFRSLNEPC